MNRMKRVAWLFLLMFAAGLLAAVMQEKGSEESKKYRRIPVKKVKLIKRVDPVYPPAALEKKIQGIVVLDAVADENGSVNEVSVVKGADPLLNDAAIQALKQWKYKPFLDESGKPIPVKFTVTMNFTLEGDGKKEQPQNPNGSCCAKLVKRVEPVYPEAASKDRLKGVIVLELQVDEKGLVKGVRLVSGHPLLNDAAVAAVRQWQYEPALGADGKPRPFSCVVTIVFALPKN